VKKSKSSIFNAIFTRQIAAMVRGPGLRMGQVFRDMKLGETALRRWLVQWGCTTWSTGFFQACSRRATARRYRHPQKSIGLLKAGTTLSVALVQPLQPQAVTANQRSGCWLLIA